MNPMIDIGVIDNDLLVENLELLRQELCAYGPFAERCDCKFRFPDGAPSMRRMRRSEVTGCAELRLAITRLSG